jgi:uncharacterized protein
MKFRARVLVPGSAEGPTFAIAPLSFWGGLDAATGTIIDRSHPDFGRSLAGTTVVMTSGRGSSSSSSVLAEAIRLGTAPVAIVLAEPDPILAVGAMVAETLYGGSCPIVVLSASDHAAAARLARLNVGVEPDGAGFVSDVSSRT